MACWPPRTCWTDSARGAWTPGCKGDYAMIVRRIMPLRPAFRMIRAAVVSTLMLFRPENAVTRRSACKALASMRGRIILTVIPRRRRHGQAAERTGPQGGRAGPGALPEPAPRTGDRPGVPGQRL